MMTAAAPATKAVGNAIVAYLKALTYANGSKVYAMAQLDQLKDIIGLISNGGVCVEVYGNMDSSAVKSFGGGIWDEQTWYILSMCSLDDTVLATEIYDARDALVQPFGVHYELGNTISGLFWSRLKPDSGRFLRILRNGQEVMAHVIELETKLTWQATLAP